MRDYGDHHRGEGKGLERMEPVGTAGVPDRGEDRPARADLGRGRVGAATSNPWLGGDGLVLLILVLAGIFDGLSGNPIHSILLFAAAVALGRDAVAGVATAGGRSLAGAVGTERAPLAAADVPTVWVLVAAAAYAILVGRFGRYSWPMTAAVLLPASAVLALSWRGPVRPRADAPGPVGRAGVLAWGGVFVAAGLWELSALLLQPSLTTDSFAHPTLSVLTDPVLATHPGRSVLLFGWLAFGWFLLGR